MKDISTVNMTQIEQQIRSSMSGAKRPIRLQAFLYQKPMYVLNVEVLFVPV